MLQKYAFLVSINLNRLPINVPSHNMLSMFYITAYSRAANGSYEIEKLSSENIKIAYWYAWYYCCCLNTSIDYLQFKIDSIITGKRQIGIANEINFELSTKKFKNYFIKSDVYRDLVRRFPVFTSIVLPSQQCVPVFRLPTDKHILCCSGQDHNNLKGSVICFCHKIDNVCLN